MIIISDKALNPHHYDQTKFTVILLLLAIKYQVFSKVMNVHMYTNSFSTSILSYIKTAFTCSPNEKIFQKRNVKQKKWMSLNMALSQRVWLLFPDISNSLIVWKAIIALLEVLNYTNAACQL